MGWFTKQQKRTTPPTMPGDEVIPMFSADDKPHNRAMVVEFTYRFDDVLDSQKLKSSLERLLELGEWRKLGARVRLNQEGKLQYHVPPRYHEERPGFLWRHHGIDQSIEQHPTASRLPKAKPIPTVHGDPADIHDLAAHPDHPTCMEDWLYTDKPPLSVQLTTFSDASLLCLSWSHTFLDAVGRQTLLKAWISILDGREFDVPRFIGYKEDPIESLGHTVAPEKHVLYKNLVTGFHFILFVIYFILESILHPIETARAIQVPDSYVQDLKSEARQYLKQHLSTDDPPFLSDGDILFAWIARITFASQTYSRSRTVNLMNVFNLRGVAQNAFPPNTAYAVGNAVSASQTLITVGQLVDQPLALTALQIRNDLLKQKTPEQADAMIALGRRLGSKALVGTYDMIFAPFSNWHRARFYDFDFSSAVVRQGKPSDQRANAVGRPSYINVTGHCHNFNVRNGGGLFGKDAEGNWWICHRLRDKAWPQFEKHFKASLVDENTR